MDFLPYIGLFLLGITMGRIIPRPFLSSKKINYIDGVVLPHTGDPDWKRVPKDRYDSSDDQYLRLGNVKILYRPYPYDHYRIFIEDMLFLNERNGPKAKKYVKDVIRQYQNNRALLIE